MKNTSASAKSVTHRKATRENLQSRIARHALELWQRYQRPAGLEAEIWLEAAGDVLIEEDKLPASLRLSPA